MTVQPKGNKTPQWTKKESRIAKKAEKLRDEGRLPAK